MTETLAPHQNTMLFGHQALLARLVTAYQKQQLHHSLILTGAEGVGKETLAYHFMRAILQDDAKITAQSHPHIFVVQPQYDDKKQRFKRDITLDALTDLGKFLRLSPVTDAPRFVLVNPAQGMNNQTQNALLKVLEEPPQGAYFILLTTHVAALLPTIRSRCLLVPVSPLSQSEFTNGAQYLLPDLSFDAAEMYYILSDGALGRAIQYHDDAIPDLYAQLCQVCVTWAIERNALPAMQLADAWSGPDMTETVQAVIDLCLHRVAVMIKDRATGHAFKPLHDDEAQLFDLVQNNMPQQKLLQEHERLQRLWDEGVNAYLDRKIVLHSFFRVLAQSNDKRAL